MEPSTRKPHPDPIIEWLQREGKAVTLGNWMSLNFPDDVPDPYPGELLEEIPDELWSEVDAFLEKQARQRDTARAADDGSASSSG